MNCPNCAFPNCGHEECFMMIYTKGRRCPCCSYLEENPTPYRSNAARHVEKAINVDRAYAEFMKLTDEEKQEFSRRAWKEVLAVFGIN